MESPSPSTDGSGGAQLSREQLLEYVKRQRVRIKALEAQVAASRDEGPSSLADYDTTAAESGEERSGGADVQSVILSLQAQRSADATKIEVLEASVAQLQRELAEKELMPTPGI